MPLSMKIKILMVVSAMFCLWDDVAGTYPLSEGTHSLSRGSFPLSRIPRRPHECGNRDSRCCPGWTRTGESRLCITPICRGCGSGICTAPNLCACPDGSVQPSCPIGDTFLGIETRHTLPAPLSTCEDLGCEQRCEQVHGVLQCACISGFTIDNDGRTCRDVDECHEGRRDCYQLCINTVGSFMCTCFRGYTLADNGRTCRRLHDYTKPETQVLNLTGNSPCTQRSHRQGQPCEISPFDQMPSVVKHSQQRPCGSDGDPCGSSPQLDFGSQTPCGPGLTPCDSFIPEIPVSTDHLPPCGSDTPPCGSETPCSSQTQPCVAVPQIPPVPEDFPLLPGCMGSNCKPPSPHETTGDSQDRISQFTNTEFQPEPCIPGPCSFLPEMPPGNNPPFDSNIQNPSPCLRSTCVHNSKAPMRNTGFSEPKAEFFSPDVPPIPKVPRGTFPCPRSGCQTGYNSQDVSPVFNQISDLVSKPQDNIGTMTAPCHPGSGCEVDGHSSIQKFLDKATEQTPVLLSALKRPSYKMELTEYQDEWHTDHQRKKGANDDTDKSKGHSRLHTYESNTKASPMTNIPFINETGEVRNTSRVPIQQLDQSLLRRLHRRRKLKRTRKIRRRRKNKRKPRTKIARTGKPTRLRNRKIKKKNNNEPNIHRTTQSLPVEYTSGSTTTVSTIRTPTVTRSSFEDKIKSFLTEFNKLRGRQRALSQTDQRHETGRSPERRGQARICQDDLCTSYVTTFPTHPPVPPTHNTSPIPSDVNIPSNVPNDVAPTPIQRTESVRQQIICGNDQIALDVPGGAICQKKSNGKMPLTTCPPGQTVTRSRMGYVCAATSELMPVCGNGTALTLVMGRFVCEELTPTCTPGESKVLTNSGWGCISKPTLPPCPEGVDPVETPIGRLCQYTGREEALTPRCPLGQEAVRSRYGYTCEDVYTIQMSLEDCSPGFISLATTDGQRCIKDPSLSLGSVSCPEGFLLLLGECRAVDKIADSGEKPCPLGQKTVLTNNGQICQYRTRGNHGNSDSQLITTSSHHRSQGNREFSLHNPDNSNNYNVYADSGIGVDDIATNCPPGQILTKKRSRFLCDMTTVDVTDWICSPSEVIVQLTSELACVKETQTTIVCRNDLELGWSSKDHEFTCLHSSTLQPDNTLLATQAPSLPMPEVPAKRKGSLSCGIGEVQVIDDEGRRCVVMETGDGLCGDTYIVQTLENGQKICKSRTMTLKCPDMYELVTSDQTSECLPIEGPAIPMSPCEDTYSISDDDGEVRCVLSPLGDDCPDKASNCGRSFESLKMACNPQCSNGGVCKDGICVCPPGVTGVACQQDIDECQLLPMDHCQYHCLNTFGSYRCVCPPGRAINSDGLTCSDIECTPECLNGGHCRAGTCHCAAGFEGKFCQTDIDECVRHSGLCEHHCRNTYGGYACVCSPGSRLRQDGRTCVNTTCVPACKNGGVCIQYRCRCPRGYQGITCQLDVNECLELPCSHICTNVPGGYTCACPTGFELGTDGHTCSNSTITGV